MYNFYSQVNRCSDPFTEKWRCKVITNSQWVHAPITDHWDRQNKKKGFTVTNTNNNDPLHALAIIMTVGTFFTPVVRSGELWPSTYFLYNPLSIKASQLKCQHACTMSIKHARLWTIYGPLSLSSLHSQFT